jgi:hypothetical protein
MSSAAVHRLIQHAARRWQRSMALAVALLSAASLILLWLVIILLDARYPLTPRGMLVAAMLLGAACAAGASSALWQLARRPANGVVATRWDAHRGDAAHRLLIAVQLADGQSIGCATLADAAMARAAASISTTDAPRPRQLLRTASIALLASALAAMFLAWLMPGSVFATTRRLMAPLYDLPTYTRATFDIAATPEAPTASEPWRVAAVVEHPSNEVVQAWVELDDQGVRARVAMLRAIDARGRAAFHATWPVPPMAMRFRINTPVGSSDWLPMPPIARTSGLPHTSGNDAPSAADDATKLRAGLDDAIARIDDAIRAAERDGPADVAARHAMSQAMLTAEAAASIAAANGKTPAAQRMREAVARLRDAAADTNRSAAARLAEARAALTMMRDALPAAPSRNSAGDKGVGEGAGSSSEPSSASAQGTAGADDARPPTPLDEGLIEDTISPRTQDGATAASDLYAVPPIYRDAAAEYLRRLENE